MPNITMLKALINGEMSPSNIPVAPGVDLTAIKAGDTSPVEVVAEVPAGESTRGWNYKKEALQDIVNHVNTNTLNGFLGHQDPEKVANEFPTPVTHWVGAKMEGESAFFRGVIDPAAEDLKRWVKAKRIKQVSIYGIPQLKKVGSKTEVVGYKPMSIDWTPLDRSGMPTKIVAVGEMDSTFAEDDLDGEMDGSFEETRDAVRHSLLEKFPSDSTYAYIRRTFADHVIAEVETSKNNIRSTKIYSVPYSLLEDAVILGDPVEVMEQRIYIPVDKKTGEMDTGGADQPMGWKEKVAEINNLLKNGEVTVGQVVGEMGIKAEHVAPELVKEHKDTLGDLEQVKQALGVTGEMSEVLQVAKAAKEALDAEKVTKHEATIDAVIKEKVTGEMAQALAKKMIHVEMGATKEQITGELDQLLADNVWKETLSKLHLDKPPMAGTGGKNNSSSSSLTTSRIPV